MASTRRLNIPPPSGFGPLPFSSGILVGNTFYTSGHIGVDPATKKIPADINEEIRLLLDGFRETLQRARLAMEDLVFVQIFCSDVSLFETFNAAYRRYFSAEFPARAFLGCGRLLFDAHFEIQGIAVKRGKHVREGRRKR